MTDDNILSPMSIREAEAKRLAAARAQRLEEARRRDDQAFQRWMQEVDKHLRMELGAPSDELPDYHFRDCFDDGQDPEDVAIDMAELLINGEL